MTEYDNNNQLTDAFILAKGDSTHLFEKLINEIEIIQGHIRHAFSPKVIFASIPTGKLEELFNNPLVEFLTTKKIDIPHPILSAKEYMNIITVWNKQIIAKQDTTHKTKTDEGLSWDTPGYLPPDPPPEIRKMMRKWEDDMEKSGDDQ